MNVVSSLYDIPDADFSKCFIYNWENKFIVRTMSTTVNKSPIYLGVFVLAYSRDLMMNYFDIIGRDNVIATETDSMYFHSSHLPKIADKIGKEIGYLDIDDFGNIKRAYFLAKKAYALHNPDNPDPKKRYKYRLKGVPSKCLSWIKYEEWWDTGSTSFTVNHFKRDLFNDSSIRIGDMIKQLR